MKRTFLSIHNIPVSLVRAKLLKSCFKTANFLYGGLKDNIFFLHIAKCGGGSIDSAINRKFLFPKARPAEKATADAAVQLYQLSDPYERDFYYVFKLRENLLLYFMNQNKPFISGHFTFSDIAYRNFKDKYKFITMLRNPVKRWISHYFYNRYKELTDQHCRIEKDLLAFADSERGKNLGHLFVKCLSGLNESGDYCSDRAIERAKENLHKFDIVGCIEYIDDFTIKFKNLFGKKLKIPRIHKNPKSTSFISSIISKEIEEQITLICKPDLEVYTYAVDTFIQRFSADAHPR
jgi:hypothetical protein